MTLSIEEFDVARLVREVAGIVQPLTAKNSNRLELSCPGDLGSMRADQTKLRQIVFNLLSNASKFTEHGLIRLEVERTSSRPVIDSELGRETPAVQDLTSSFSA